MRILLGILIATSALIPGYAETRYDGLRPAFERFSAESRVELQKQMTSEGYYTSRADGRYGPATEAALMRYLEVHPATVPEADLFARLAEVIAYFPEKPMPFFGSWSCGAGGPGFEYSKQGYSSGEQVLPYRFIDDFSDAFGVEFVDGYRIYLSSVERDTMVWHSPESGDTFDCTRDVDAAATPEISETVKEQSASVPLEAAPEATGTEASSSGLPIDYPLLGKWTCQYDMPTAQGSLSVLLEKSRIHLEEPGHSEIIEILYREKGPAFSEYIHLTGAEAFTLITPSKETMYLYDGGVLFSCARE